MTREPDLPPELASLRDRVAVVTGASSGFGRAVARRLGALGARVVMGARRMDRLETTRAAVEAGGGVAEAFSLDVADRTSSEAFAAEVLRRHGAIDILVNNAGLARGFAPVLDNDEADWREMIEANVMGLMRMTRLFLPALIERGAGDIVHVGSIAGLQPYANGAAYCASKAAVEAFAQALRLELAGKNIRQLVIEPGMANTEFSEVRFHGDRARADRVYEGVEPLGAEDVADCIVFALTRPRHVCIQTLLVTPTAQAAANVVARESR
jgi:3-hydroxy acid dehydrogenase/malonic semialdehyde reductase